VRLADQILFDPGKTELKKDGQEALRQVTAVLKEIPNRDFQVAENSQMDCEARDNPAIDFGGSPGCFDY